MGRRTQSLLSNNHLHKEKYVIVSYKYRAYPDAIVETWLYEAPDTCRWLYNKLLEGYNRMEQPFESVEMIPLHHISVMQVFPMIAGKPRTAGRGVVHPA